MRPDTILMNWRARTISFGFLENTEPFGEYETVMYMDSWKEAKEWLEGVVFDDPAVSDRVEKILQPEHFKEKKPSVLKKLEKKKKDIQTVKKKADPVSKREKNTQVL